MESMNWDIVESTIKTLAATDSDSGFGQAVLSELPSIMSLARKLADDPSQASPSAIDALHIIERMSVARDASLSADTLDHGVHMVAKLVLAARVLHELLSCAADIQRCRERSVSDVAPIIVSSVH